MGSAEQGDGARFLGRGQREQKSLQHQRGGARGTDIEPIGSRTNGTGPKGEGVAAELGAAQLCAADGGRRMYTGEVLATKTWLAPTGTNMPQREGPPREEGEG